MLNKTFLFLSLLAKEADCGKCLNSLLWLNDYTLVAKCLHSCGKMFTLLWLNDYTLVAKCLHYCGNFFYSCSKMFTLLWQNVYTLEAKCLHSCGKMFILTLVAKCLYSLLWKKIILTLVAKCVHSCGKMFIFTLVAKCLYLLLWQNVYIYSCGKKLTLLWQILYSLLRTYFHFQYITFFSPYIHLEKSKFD